MGFVQVVNFINANVTNRDLIINEPPIRNVISRPRVWYFITSLYFFVFVCLFVFSLTMKITRSTFESS